MADLHVSWQDYHHQIERLAALIQQSGWSFNQIVCLARGGMRVGDILSRLYRQPLAILAATSYGGTDGQVRGKLRFAEHLTMTTDRLGDRVLLVDDLVDSGISLEQAVVWLRQHHGTEIAEVRTAVLWYKACSAIAPDYYAAYLADNPWIHQPFERYERISPAELLPNSMFSAPELAGSGQVQRMSVIPKGVDAHR